MSGNYLGFTEEEITYLQTQNLPEFIIDENKLLGPSKSTLSDVFFGDGLLDKFLRDYRLYKQHEKFDYQSLRGSIEYSTEGFITKIYRDFIHVAMYKSYALAVLNEIRTYNPQRFFIGKTKGNDEYGTNEYGTNAELYDSIFDVVEGKKIPRVSERDVQYRLIANDLNQKGQLNPIINEELATSVKNKLRDYIKYMAHGSYINSPSKYILRGFQTYDWMDERLYIQLLDKINIIDGLFSMRNRVGSPTVTSTIFDIYISGSAFWQQYFHIEWLELLELRKDPVIEKVRQNKDTMHGALSWPALLESERIEEYFLKPKKTYFDIYEK